MLSPRAMVAPVTAQELRRLRKKAGLTQGALARKVGVQMNSVWRWEAGRVPITTPMARLIRMILKAGT
jgi:DNA-binding transcriptional regulator YiaG